MLRRVKRKALSEQIAVRDGRMKESGNIEVASSLKNTFSAAALPKVEVMAGDGITLISFAPNYSLLIFNLFTLAFIRS